MADVEPTDQGILESVAEALDLAILVRPRDSREAGFRLIGPAPAWFASCFGSGEECLERSAFLDDFVHGAAADCWRVAGRRESSGLWEESTPEGTPRYFEATALHLGNHEVLVVALADEQHRREREYLQRAHDEALHQRRLAKEREKKEMLLDCIVHDLSGPLSTILMNLQHVGRRLDRDDLRQALIRAESQAERQRALIRSVADVFSSDLSHFEPALLAGKEGVEIASVVREMVDAFQPSAEKKQIRLTLEIDSAIDAGLRVVGERDHLARVIDNLLANALHRGPAGSNVTVWVQSGDGRVRTSVHDQAAPIPAGMRERIFVPFAGWDDGAGSGGEEELEDAQERDHPALGLAYCRMTVELWGGSIGIEDRPAEGNRFWFELPEHRPETGETGGGEGPQHQTGTKE